MESADPSDQHKVAVVRVGNSVKLIDYMEEKEATADANVPARGSGQRRAGSLGQTRLEEIEFSARGAILSGAIQLRDKFRVRTVDSSDSTRCPETGETLRRDAEARETAWRAEMLAKFRREKVSPEFIYAFEKTGNFVTSENRDDWSEKELKEWDRLLQEYHRRTAMEGRVIDLCFRLPLESGRSTIGRQRRFAASELGIAVLSAHEHGISSFAVEQIFRESWLDAAVRRSRAADSEWDPTDHHRFDYVDRASVRNVLNQLRDDLPEQRLPVSMSAVIEKRIAKIEAARAIDGSWLGKPPAPSQEGEREKAVVIDEIHHAIFHCEQEGVPEDVIESMLLRSWIRMRVFNEHEDERVFHVLDKSWEQVHATFQIRMAGYSGLRVQ
jgi:hypothetical protein